MSIDLSFFGLREHPFNPTPDPRFLHMTPGHREALAQLAYGVERRAGFMLLTGEVGTGKTTLLQALLRRLDDRTAVAFITNSMLRIEGILEYMLEDLGVKSGESHAQRLFALQSFLTERRRADQNAVLILDEAQDLDVQTLEHIRQLSNFETASEKILQILLVGQPELRAKLDQPELRQLKQRIGLRCSLQPLSTEEVGHYIRTRLRVAGAQDLHIFTNDAIVQIGRHSGGIPRVVNTLCDHCLLFGYADQVRRLDRGIAQEVIRYLEADASPQRGHRRSSLSRWGAPRLRWSLLGVSTAAVPLAWLAVTYRDVLWQFARSALAVIGL